MVTLNKGRNRIEQRVVRTSTVLNTDLDWPYVGRIFRKDRPVPNLLGKHRRDEVAFGVTDLRPKFASSQRIGKLARGHWRIETGLHDVRDMAFDEDRSQIRTGSGPQVMATLRNIAIGFIRRMKLPNIQRTLEHLGRRPDPGVCLTLELAASSHSSIMALIVPATAGTLLCSQGIDHWTSLPLPARTSPISDTKAYLPQLPDK